MRNKLFIVIIGICAFSMITFAFSADLRLPRKESFLAAARPAGRSR